ncbi:MAG: hypothetical protein GY842_15325, partial [bacterium]|nr:hypothetical protein [bacterium]
LLLLQGTACLGLGLAGSYLWRRRAARAHQILLVGLLASVVMPALYVSVQHFELGLLATRAPAVPSEPLEFTAPAPLRSSDPPMLIASTVEYEPLAAEATAPAAPVSIPTEETTAVRIPWSLVLLTGWLVMSVVLLSRLLLRFGLGLRLLARTEPVEAPSLLDAVESARTRFGLNAALEIRRSADVRSPVIWCWRKPPVLLVQQDIAKTSATNDLAGVFCHELAHWKRLDHLSGLLAELMVCVMPWNPLLWWAKSRLLKLSEEVCDDWVLASGQAGVDYAESLLDLSPQREMAFVPTVLGKEKAMKERIHRIVSEECGDPRIGTRWMGTVCVLALVCTVGVAFAQHRPAEHGRHEQTEHREFREQHEHNEERHDLAVAGRRNVLERMLDQLFDQARETEAALDAQGDEPGPRGHVLRSELDALRDHIGIIERQLQGLQRTEPSRREGDAPHERAHETEAHAEELARHQEEWGEKMRLMERELEALGDRQPEKREQIITELREIHEHMKSLDRDHAHLDQQRAGGSHEHTQKLAEHLHELQAHGTDVKHRLERMDDPDSNEARELRAHLDNLHEETRHMEEQLEDLRSERREEKEEAHEEEFEGQFDPMAERIRDLEIELQAIHKRGEGDGQVARRLRQDVRKVREERRRVEQRDRRAQNDELLAQAHEGLTAQIRMTEDRLKAAREQDSPAVEKLHRVLEQLHQRRESLEGQAGQLGDAPRERPGIEVEVEELRGKVNGMHEEMTQMRKLLEQLLERRQKRIETEEVEEFQTIR